MKIIFIRHGRTDYNEKGLMDYMGEANLTEAGKSQAQEIAFLLKNEDIKAIYTSPLQRCIDTITPLAELFKQDLYIIDEFIEINSPDLQGKEFSCKNYKWENGYGGGETIKEAFFRVTVALQEIIESHENNDTVVICSHGDPSFLMRLYFHPEFNYDTDKYTCGLYLENNPAKFEISAMFGEEKA